MNEYEVVVHDPSGKYWDGSLVLTASSGMLRSEGGITLPIDAKQVTQGGASGWYKRAWGAGWPLDYPTPQLACRMLLSVPQGESVVHWAAMLMAGPDVLKMIEEPNKLSMLGHGTVSLTSDQQQSLLTGTYAPGTQPVSLKALEKELKAGKGTCIVRGQGSFRAERAGVHGFAVFGSMPGMRVAWAAVSSAERAR